MTEEFKRQVFFREIDEKRKHDGWLDEKGNFYYTMCHISWVNDDLESVNEELYKEYREWHSNRTEKERWKTGIEFLMKNHGWWKRSSIADSRLWLGEVSATPAQRKYINNDMGERQSNEYFDKGH